MRVALAFQEHGQLHPKLFLAAVAAMCFGAGFVLMHTNQIIERYEAKEAVFQHKAVIININRSAEEKGIYEAVRHAWKIDPKKARNADIVLAVMQGLIVGAFIADEWLAATTVDFPGVAERPGRWGFAASR